MLSTRAVHHTGRITHLLLGQLHATSPRTSHKASCLTLSHGHSRAIYQIVADGGKIPPMEIDCCNSTNLQQSWLLCYGSTQLGLVLHPLMLTATEPTLGDEHLRKLSEPKSLAASHSCKLGRTAAQCTLPCCYSAPLRHTQQHPRRYITPPPPRLFDSAVTAPCRAYSPNSRCWREPWLPR